jgi:hypothetical protein
MMTATFDIFRVETDGNVYWLKTAATLDDAKAVAQELAPQANGLIILDQKTGEKYIVHSSGSANGSSILPTATK